MKNFAAASSAILILIVASTSTSSGQEIELCSCAPSTYEFTLDFDLFCPPVNITLGDGVLATSCFVSPFGDPTVTDLIPIAVQSIGILELGQDVRVLNQENIEGNFGDGDTFQYTSVAANPVNIVDSADIPRALQLNLIGLNANDEPIINVYIITFTNNCGTYPVLFEGQSAGWTVFSDLAPPLREFCPLVPTSDPSPAPSVAETESPTTEPTIAVVTEAPNSPVPSDMPSLLPTITGTEMTSDGPSMIPTAESPPPIEMSMPPIEMSMPPLEMSMSTRLRFMDSVDVTELVGEVEFGSFHRHIKVGIQRKSESTLSTDEKVDRVDRATKTVKASKTETDKKNIKAVRRQQ